MLSNKSKLLSCVSFMAMVAALTVGRASAALIGTYVDATTSNTTPSSAFPTTESDEDNLWFVESRTGCRNNDVLASNGSPEDSPMVTTTVSGLANGAYNVYVNYWVNTNSDAQWNVQSAISGNTLVTYDKTNGTATGVTFNSIIHERQALLGQVTVTNGSFAVDVDDWSGTRPCLDYDVRTWYDGVAYEAVATPEPGTLALMAIGMVGLLAYAWRKRK
jgi:hypothetical protein